jgi:hypothetical protein
MPDEATLRRFADRTIAGMQLANVRPERFWASARAGSRHAADAAARGDFDAAVEAKQKELTNLALYRAALAAREAIDQARERNRAMFTPDADLAKRRNMDYVNAARVIAAEYFFPEQRRRTSADEALELVGKHNPELHDTLIERVRAARATGADLGTMTYENFQVLQEGIDALWEQSLRAQQMLINGQLVDRNLAKAALEARLDDLGTLGTQYERIDSPLTSTVLGLRAAVRRVEHWCDYVDGGDPNGAFRTYVWNPVVAGIEAYRLQRSDYITRFLDLVKPIEATLTPGVIPAPELGFTFESRNALLHAIAHTGNQSNFEKLLRGRQWGELTPAGTVDASRWVAFMARAFREGIVTKADMDFVQSLWDLNEELKGAAQQAHRDMYGHYFSEVTAWPVQTPFGTYRGGYMPAVVDPNLAADAASRADERALVEGADNSFMFPSTGRGFTKARVDSYAKPLALDLTLYPRHLDQVLRFVHIQPRVRDVGRLLMDWNLKERLAAYDPKARGEMLLPWLQRAASQQVSQPGRFREIDAFWRAVRTRTGLNMMAGHVVNTLQQFTGLSVAALKIPPRNLRHALYRYVTDHRRVVEFAHASSPFMRTRLTAAAIEVQRTIDDLLLNPSKYEKARAFASRHGYILQATTQSAVDVIAWTGAYEEAVERHGDTALAIREADSAVRQTQGSFAPEDASRFEVQTPFVRAFTLFSGYFNTLANVNGTEFGKVVRDMGLRKGAGRGFYIYAFGFMAPAVLSEIIMQAAGGFDGDDDEEWYSAALRMFFGSQLRQGAAMVPGVGPASIALVNHFNDNPYDDRISMSPAIQMIESTVRAPHSVYQAIAGEGGKKKAVRDALDAIGLLTGLPVGAIKRPAGYLADVVDGRQSPDSALELTSGLVTGRGLDAAP